MFKSSISTFLNVILLPSIINNDEIVTRSYENEKKCNNKMAFYKVLPIKCPNGYLLF